MEQYFTRAKYPLCEYNFNTLMLWHPVEKYSCFYTDSCAFIISSGDNPHALMPITTQENWIESVKFLIDYHHNLGKKLTISFATEEFADFIAANFLDQISVTANRDAYDYIYSVNELMVLKGRKFEKKRNHINKFKKTHYKRYSYRPLKEDDFEACRSLLNYWKDEKIATDDTDEESINNLKLKNGINNLFSNYKILDIKIGGIYIDNVLEAFTIGSCLLPDMAEIHVEMANPNIRGLYQVLNQLFLSNEFPKAIYVNREDDAGVEGIRRAKLSYKPLKLLPKYDIKFN